MRKDLAKTMQKRCPNGSIPNLDGNRILKSVKDCPIYGHGGFTGTRRVDVRGSIRDGTLFVTGSIQIRDASRTSGYRTVSGHVCYLQGSTFETGYAFICSEDITQ
jgi:hypothetical protein